MNYPLPTLAATVSATGISAPAYTDILLSLQASYATIFGTDAYIAPDSQDGQLLAIVAKAISDCNDMAIAVYNSFAPTTAQGTGLSNLVKLNGIARKVPTYSQVNVTVTGQAGTIITNGVVTDSLSSSLWNLPTPLVIPIGGSVLVAATAQQPGAFSAAIGTITKIQNPQLGWQTVTNPSAATVGSPLETDSALRARQASSVALPSLSTVASIVAGIKALAGVSQVAAYENDTNATDSNGLPPHSISMVVVGGAATDIAAAILAKKTPGTSTFGSTAVLVSDPAGVGHTINFGIPVQKTITVAISLHPLTAGYTTAIGTKVQQSVVDYINALLIGEDIYRDRLFMPAQLYGAADSKTFNITAIQIAISPAAVGNSDLVIAYNEEAIATLASVTVTIV